MRLRRCIDPSRGLTGRRATDHVRRHPDWLDTKGFRSVILLASILFSLGIGSILMMQQILTAEAFGTRE
jgi:hypothetical protein